jgi:hypothetical protein
VTTTTGYAQFDKITVCREFGAIKNRETSLAPTGFGKIQNRDVNLLVDGNMEAAGIGAWTATSATTLEKVAGASDLQGTRVLKINFSSASRAAYQNILTVGKKYRARGRAAGDGLNAPSIDCDGVSNMWVGTTSEAWQAFDATFTGHNSATFYLLGGSSAGFTKYDNVSVTEVY